MGITGATLEKTPKSKVRLDAAFAHLTRLSNNAKVYSSRVRFVIKDLIDQRAQNWVARRETFTVRRSPRWAAQPPAHVGTAGALQQITSFSALVTVVCMADGLLGLG